MSDKRNNLLIVILLLLLLSNGISIYYIHSINREYKRILEDYRNAYDMMKLEYRDTKTECYDMISQREKRIRELNSTIENLERMLTIYNNIAISQKIKLPSPRWKVTILRFPNKVEPGKKYEVVYEVQNLLPIKDSIRIVGYFFREDSWKYNDTYTTPIFINNSWISLPAHGKIIVNGTLEVPEDFPTGKYIITGALTYYDVFPVEYIDRRQVELL